MRAQREAGFLCQLPAGPASACMHVRMYVICNYVCMYVPVCHRIRFQKPEPVQILNARGSKKCGSGWFMLHHLPLVPASWCHLQMQLALSFGRWSLRCNRGRARKEGRGRESATETDRQRTYEMYVPRAACLPKQSCNPCEPGMAKQSRRKRGQRNAAKKPPLRGPNRELCRRDPRHIQLCCLHACPAKPPARHRTSRARDSRPHLPHAGVDPASVSRSRVQIAVSRA